MKTKTLWSDKKGVFRVIEKEMKDGALVLSKKARINVEKLDNAIISYPDKMVNFLAMAVSGLGGGIGLVAGGSEAGMLLAPVGFLGGLIGVKIFMARRIYYPLICARWNSSQPFDLLKAKPSKAFKVNEKVQVQKRVLAYQKKLKFLTIKKKMVWKTIKTYNREVGELEFVDMKLNVPEGIEVITPENYQNLHRNVALETMMRPDKGNDIPWLMCAIFAMVGFFMAVAFFPHGLEAFIQSLQQSASSTAAAVIPQQPAGP
jgi:hypothetical protein